MSKKIKKPVVTPEVMAASEAQPDTFIAPALPVPIPLEIAEPGGPQGVKLSRALLIRPVDFPSADPTKYPSAMGRTHLGIGFELILSWPVLAMRHVYTDGQVSDWRYTPVYNVSDYSI